MNIYYFTHILQPQCKSPQSLHQWAEWAGWNSGPENSSCFLYAVVRKYWWALLRLCWRLYLLQWPLCHVPVYILKHINLLYLHQSSFHWTVLNKLIMKLFFIQWMDNFIIHFLILNIPVLRLIINVNYLTH